MKVIALVFHIVFSPIKCSFIINIYVGNRNCSIRNTNSNRTFTEIS